MKNTRHIALIGGGPSSLFTFKRLVEKGDEYLHIDIYEQKDRLGEGMPYSKDGAGLEHITNVSGNEIPDLPCPLTEWLHTIPLDVLGHYGLDPENIHEYKVLPRLLFGKYLSDQFERLKNTAVEKGIDVHVHLSTKVQDIIDHPDQNNATVLTNKKEHAVYDHVIICSGHDWPAPNEEKIPGFFDSPYPPAKLKLQLNHPVAIRGSSLTAIDAVKTLARENGKFVKLGKQELVFQPDQNSKNFKIVMHSRNGLLPAVRFHLEDSHLSKDSVLNEEEIAGVRAANDGFLPLDYVFEKNFKEPLKERDPEFYKTIRDMRMEEFVESMMDLREKVEPFNLLEAEYTEAEKSISRHETVHWKEMLAVLSFAMNYPAKYFSAEDILRVKKVLMPLISIVIAFVPQSSVEEMLALHKAGKLEVVSVGDDSYVTPEEGGGATYHYKDERGKPQAVSYNTYIDSVGQVHLSWDELPYRSLVEEGSVSPATLRFRDASFGEKLMEMHEEKITRSEKGDYFLQVPGVAINDNFQIVDKYGAYNERIYMMAVPYIGGYNPDYSGLDFCEAASKKIADKLLLREAAMI